MTDAATRPDGRRMVLALLLACATLTVMAGATIAPSLPGLLAHFRDVPDAQRLVPFVLTVPGLAIAVCAPLAGVLVDRTDPRRVLLVSILAYVLAGSSGLYLDGLGGIIIGRVLLGVAVGGVMTASTTLLSNIFSGPERGRVLGYQASAMGFGGVLFILAGGLLADLSWRGPFAVYLLPVVLLPLILRVLPAPPRAVAQADHVPAARFPVIFAALIYASGFAMFLIFYMIPTQLPFLMAGLGAERASTTGYVIALNALASAGASLLYGRVRAQLSPATIGALCYFVLAAAYLAISAAGSVTVLFFLAPVVGASLGLLMPNHITWLMAAVPAPMRGRANGMMTMAIFLAQFVSAFVGAALVAAGGLRAAFWGMAILAAALAVVYAMLRLSGRARRAAA